MRADDEHNIILLGVHHENVKAIYTFVVPPSFSLIANTHYYCLLYMLEKSDFIFVISRR